MKVLLIFLFLIFSAPQVFAGVFEHEASLSEISRKLPALNDISCKFTQERVISGSGIVLNSKGDFKFEKQNGVTFYTTYPIKSTTSYTSKEFQRINNVITAISNKSYAKLEKDFRFFYLDGWTLGLVPKKNSQTANHLKSVEISGNQEMITRIVILSADGTRTTLYFRGGG